MENDSFSSADNADGDETAARPLKRHRTGIDSAVMEPPSKKRSATSPATQSGNAVPFSGLIGLKFPTGGVRYIHRSTLVNAGGYFSKRFGDNGILAGGEATTDSDGVPIYFVERDGDLFDKHILPFIIGKIPGELPPFSERPALWRLLREEAKFYGLDELSDMLDVTFSCPYTIGNDRGVLHWLGTGKGTHEYKNPHESGAVSVYIGKLGDLTFRERIEISGTHHIELDARAFTQESRASLVQYRPKVVGYDEERNTCTIRALNKCYSLWCDMSLSKIPAIVDLRTVSLRLMAYSLRGDECGMTDWNLEASQDGENWTVLHEARNDRHLIDLSDDHKKLFQRGLDMCCTIEEAIQVTQEYAEREYRHTWKISPPSDAFHRYFRIIGSGTDYERAEDSCTCLHGVGLEFYGDIHEEYKPSYEQALVAENEEGETTAGLV